MYNKDIIAEQLNRLIADKINTQSSFTLDMNSINVTVAIENGVYVPTINENACSQQFSGVDGFSGITYFGSMPLINNNEILSIELNV